MRGGTLCFPIMLLMLTGCASFPSFGSLNLGDGLFGGARTARTGLAPSRGYPDIADPRPPAARIVGIAAERTATGVLLRATVAVPAAGYMGVQLAERRQAETGVIVLDARLQGRAGPAAATAIAAIFLPYSKLGGTREIRLVSAANSVSYRP